MTSTVTSTVAVIDPSTGDGSTLIEILHLIPNAYKGHDLTLLFGLLLSGLIILVRLWEGGRYVSDARAPWVLFGLAFLGGVARGLELHESVPVMLSVSMTCGLVAVGGWAAFEDMVVNLLKAIMASRPAPPNGGSGGPGAKSETPPVPDARPLKDDPSGKTRLVSGAISVCPRCMGPIGRYTGLCPKCRYATPTSIHAFETEREDRASL
jgi:hypothetical protein